MEQNKLLIGYYRLSMEDDAERESNSITNQRLLVKDYIANTRELAVMPFQEFYDDGYSGASMERPAMKEVLELIWQDRVQCIVVKDFSRFSRDYIELGTYLEQIFPFMGIRFISISDRYDSLDYRGKMSDIEVQFKGLIADFYIKDQSVKVKSAVKTKREKGEYCCGSAPYGYMRNPENKKELLIVEEEAEVIRRVYDLTINRYTKMQICQILNAEKVPTPLQSMSKRQKADKRKAASKNLQWTPDMIRKILDDKNYIGCMVYGKTKIINPGTGREAPVPREQWKVQENHHAPIISREVFDKVQGMRARHCTKSKHDKTSSLLGGYIKCGNCRRNLTASKELHGHILYSCAYSKGKEDTECFAGKVDNRILEQLVWKELKKRLQEIISREQMEQSMREQHRELIKEYENEIRDCEKQLEEAKVQHSKNYEKYHEGEMSREIFLEKRKKIEISKDALQKQIQELKTLIGKEEDVLLKKNIPVERLVECLGHQRLTRELVEKYLEVVYAYDDGTIEIEWIYEK